MPRRCTMVMEPCVAREGVIGERENDVHHPEVLFEITDRCHLDCIFCSTDACAEKNTFLDKRFIFTILEELETTGTGVVQLSGGEPFLHPDILELVNAILRRGFVLEIYSSGTGPREAPIPASLLRGMNRGDQISIRYNLQSPCKKTHSALTRHERAFQNVLASIANTVQAGIPAEVHFLPTTMNASDFTSLVTLCERLGVSKLKVLRFVPQGRGALHQDLLLSVNQLRAFQNTVLDGVSCGGLAVDVGKSFSLPGVGGCKKCLAGIKKHVIDCNRNLFPCAGLKQLPSFSTRCEASYLESVHSPGFDRVMAKLNDTRRRMKHVPPHLGGCAAQFSWDGTRQMD